MLTGLPPPDPDRSKRSTDIRMKGQPGIPDRSPPPLERLWQVLPWYAAQ